MAITSLAFVGFAAFVLVIYYLLPRRPQNYWLLAASYAFYVTWAWEFAVVLTLLILVNFGLAKAIQGRSAHKRLLLWIGIGFNVLALAFFKYADFFVPEMVARQQQANGQMAGGGFRLLLPIGLSFMILEGISYLVDVYRDQVQAASDLVDFALYLAYFPKLLSGPIERYRSFSPKLAQPRVVDNETLARSFMLIVVGLVRKLVVADLLLLLIPKEIVLTPGEFDASRVALWLIAYGFWLYNDFAGYTSMVRGLSGLFGIELSPNFQIPYFARNFTEFWNRWHITLSHWLRDYIYFPLSRALLRRNPSRRNLLNLILPPIATMLISGLWHEASLFLLIWGALHGVYQIVERLPSLWRPVVPPDKWPLWRQGIAVVGVVVLALLAWIPFGVGVSDTPIYWRDSPDKISSAGLDSRLLVTMVPGIWLDWVQYRRGEFAFLRWPRLARATLLAFAFLAVLGALQIAATPPPFVYQGF